MAAETTVSAGSLESQTHSSGESHASEEAGMVQRGWIVLQRVEASAARPAHRWQLPSMAATTEAMHRGELADARLR